VRNTAIAASFGRWGKAFDLTSNMVDVSVPALAEESFADSMPDAPEAYNVAASGTNCHLLKSGI